MKKLSDYRIREENGKFYVEKQVTETFVLFKKKTVSEWFSVDKWGYCRIPINSEFFNGRMVLIEDHSKAFDTIEEAKAQIIKWCEEPKKPKYHYVVEDNRLFSCPNFALGEKRYITQSMPCFSDECQDAYDYLFMKHLRFAANKFPTYKEHKKKCSDLLNEKDSWWTVIFTTKK